VVTTSIFERFGGCGPDGDANAAAHCESELGPRRGYVCKAAACLRSFPAEAGKLRLRAAIRARAAAQRAPTRPRSAKWVASDVQAGRTGRGSPRGWKRCALALADPSSGFLRDGAKVVVAFFSDAEDCLRSAAALLHAASRTRRGT